MTDTPQDLRRTPLFSTHVSLGGRIVPFAGWEMPVQYASILNEARAVRARAGLFDVSHMGRVDIRGPGAATFLNRLLSSDIPGLQVGRARYGVICNESGGIIDDCIAYRRDRERYLLIPNASNAPTVLDWLSRWAETAEQVQIDDVTSESAMIAHQGPGAVDMLSGLTPTDLSSVRPFRAVETTVAGVDAYMARTGYTGEDGFEIIVPQEEATNVWQRLAERGAEPCGLAARDVLRLEASLPLHGNDIDTSTNPYEAGLGRFVDPDREGYIAGEALRSVRAKGVTRTLVGFNMIGRGVPRHEHPIVDGTSQIGHVTSGGYSPILDRNIGMGYVPVRYSSPGTRLHIDIRGRLVEAEVTSLPFYSRRKST